MEKPLISVCLISYNHKPYIRQAIESILMQNHPFTWELVIADDNSTDGARDIIIEYKQRHPDLINLILQENNVGAYQNWKDLLGNAKGKYIAYLEGDDFWTDSNKLDLQASFLEANEQYVGCFHNSEERFEGDDTKTSYLYCAFPGGVDISFADLVHKNLIPSCSMFYRNTEIPGWFGGLKMGDWPLHLLNATRGKYRYIPRVMGVHRHHAGSTWMLLDTQSTDKYVLDAYDTMIRVFSDEDVYRNELKAAKHLYLHPPKPGFKRRAANFIKTFIDK